jgi:8-oxo-dGTP pyrophosphatase MutT (NUDIX family)
MKIKKPKVRPLALAIIRFKEKILVSEILDTLSGQMFYRPLGGRIEFGEYAEETVVRELKEEVGVDIQCRGYLGMIQNIFEYEGQPGHEIVLLYECEFADRSYYKKKEFPRLDIDTVTAIWKPVEDFYESKLLLVPKGITAFLNNDYKKMQTARNE